MIFRSGVPVAMAGLDVGQHATLGPEKIELVQESGPIGEVVSEILSYARTYERVTGSGPPPIYDAVAVADVVEPKVLEVRSVRVEVECKANSPAARPSVTSATSGTNHLTWRWAWTWTNQCSSRSCTVP